ncbi:hypothetical protein RJ639_016298, partial [Escallonia herrerae]
VEINQDNAAPITVPTQESSQPRISTQESAIPIMISTPRFIHTHEQDRSGIRMQAVDEDYELKQVKDMAAARKRWESLVREEKVKVLTPREAGYAIQLSDKTLLDVRPSTEHEKAWVKGSTWIPIFDVDSRFDAGALSMKVTNFMMGGWWSGMPTLSYDNQFLPKVKKEFPEDTDLIVACQKGLRQIPSGFVSYCTMLVTKTFSGFKGVWKLLKKRISQGKVLSLSSSQESVGFQSSLGNWTDQQRAAAANEGWSYRLVFSARLVGVVLAADALFIGAQQVLRYIQDIRTH